MNLTPHFTLAEMTRSGTADRLRLPNEPDDAARAALQQTAEMLERIRAVLDAPVIVTSAYRAPAVNRAVGGATTSDHMAGQAADILSPRFGTPYRVAKTLEPLVDRLGIGQLILEGVGGKQWVHVSTRPSTRAVNRVITITNAGARAGIHEVA